MLTPSGSPSTSMRNWPQEQEAVRVGMVWLASVWALPILVLKRPMWRVDVTLSFEIRALWF
jgi:hypothetical protein